MRFIIFIIIIVKILSYKLEDSDFIPPNEIDPVFLSYKDNIMQIKKVPLLK